LGECLRTAYFGREYASIAMYLLSQSVSSVLAL